MRVRFRSAALIAVAALAAVATPSAAVAKARPGQLDRSFGRHGKVTVAFPAESPGNVGIKYEVPFQFTPGHLQMALTPRGGIVIAGSTQLVRLLPNGRLDRSFGRGGRVSIERPAGQNFLLADVAVDSQGRILVAGSVRPQPTGSFPDPLISSVMVRRYNPDGSLDLSFGDQGTLITTFGIEPPKIGSSRYTAPSVGLRSMVVDQQNRPLLTGGSVTEIARCYPEEKAVSTGFVARLTQSGAPDPSFGEGGLRQVPEFASFAQGHLLPGGSLLTVASPPTGCPGRSSEPVTQPVTLTGFLPSGGLDPGFGFSGFRQVGFASAPVAALSPSGKVLLLGGRRNVGKHKVRYLAMRLLPNGAIDPRFGRTGRVRVVGPRSTGLDAIGSDAHDRLLLAGRAWHKLKRSGLNRSTFLLARLRPKGTVDRNFGRRGTVRTGFGGPSDSYATQVLVVGRGRILVGGIVSTPRLGTGGGFAIARYFGG